VTVVKSAPGSAPFDHTARLTVGTVVGPDPVAINEEARGPDGIRHELVARVRQQIADGTYDTEEKWLLAEEALLRRIGG